MTEASRPQTKQGEAAGSATPDSMSEEIQCVECGERVERRLSKDGEYCFHCAVHAACACADPTS